MCVKFRYSPFSFPFWVLLVTLDYFAEDRYPSDKNPSMFTASFSRIFFHVTHYECCAILITEDTFYPNVRCEVELLSWYQAKLACSDVIEGDTGMGPTKCSFHVTFQHPPVNGQKLHSVVDTHIQQHLVTTTYNNNIWCLTTTYKRGQHGNVCNSDADNIDFNNNNNIWQCL